MLQRKAYNKLKDWKHSATTRAMLVTGARQVGKTYIIREFGKSNYKHFIEFNFLENPQAANAINNATDSNDLFARLSAFATEPLVEGHTLIFIDEVQECKEFVTAVKFLLEKGGYDYILSGSMLGVELRDINSWPVGYLSELVMYPLDFEEFCWANGLAPDLFVSIVQDAYVNKTPVPDYLHTRLLDLFHSYLIVGGMPDAVQEFQTSSNLQQVRNIQRDIITLYRHDIAKYAGSAQRNVKQIYDLIPAELNAQNKRFVIKDIDGCSRLTRYENDFLWAADAGVALPVYNTTEPRYPLLLNKESRKFKLFMNDVGLLCAACDMNTTRAIINNRTDVNYGSIYENAICCEIACSGKELFYFANRTAGELDFVMQTDDGKVVPIEVKSGKTYKRHSALNKVLSTPNYDLDYGVVLCEGNVETAGNVFYLPVYMVPFVAGCVS